MCKPNKNKNQMTLFYQTHSWTSQPQVTEKTIKLWKKLSKKSNWRIVQLANGFYQTEYKDMQNDKVWHDVTRRETLESAEAAIDGSLDHYKKKLSFLEGPRVVKTF